MRTPRIAAALLASLTGACAQWIAVHPAAPLPAPRWQHRAVFEEASNRMIVYSGKIPSNDYATDVWVLEHASGKGGTPKWTQLDIKGPAAPGRHMAVVAYDPVSNRMITFGGHALPSGGFTADVWVLTHANGLGGAPAWIGLSPGGTPPSGREWHTAVYDASHRRMIVFGGLSTTGLVNDVWILENASGLGGTPSWIQLHPAGTPPSARAGHTAVYDAENNRMIVFGGGKGTVCPCTNNVWVLLHANGLDGAPEWIQLTPVGTPPIDREDHAAVYVANANSMIVFGGWRTAGPDQFYLNDVWTLTRANGVGGSSVWIRRKPDGPQPSPRELATAVYDPASRRTIVFGGSPATNEFATCGSGFCLNDLWLLK